MSGLKPVPARKLIRFLVSRGFHIVSQRGSHIKLRFPRGVTIIVPNHPGRDIKVGLVHSILSAADIDIEEFLKDL